MRTLNDYFPNEKNYVLIERNGAKYPNSIFKYINEDTFKIYSTTSHEPFDLHDKTLNDFQEVIFHDSHVEFILNTETETVIYNVFKNI